VKLEFSDAVKGAAGATQTDVEGIVNAGLRKMAGKNPDAKNLLNSNQTIKVICFGEKAADDLGLKKPDEIVILMGVPGFGETKGDFGPGGAPRTGGTAHIAIDCDLLKAHGWHTEFDTGLFRESMLGAFAHELLHAASEARKHGPDEEGGIYETWVGDFLAATDAERRAAAAAVPKEPEPAKTLPDQPPGGDTGDGKTGFRAGEGGACPSSAAEYAVLAPQTFCEWTVPPAVTTVQVRAEGWLCSDDPEWENRIFRPLLAFLDNPTLDPPEGTVSRGGPSPIDRAFAEQSRRSFRDRGMGDDAVFSSLLMALGLDRFIERQQTVALESDETVVPPWYPCYRRGELEAVKKAIEEGARSARAKLR
jgi:hypothetical protein